VKESGAGIRVVLADDHAMVREALSQILQESQGITVVGQTGEALEVRSLVEATRPDVAILDYSMPGLDATSLIEMLRTAFPRLLILVLTVHENIHYAVRALETGAHGYVVKSAALDQLVEAIHAVRAGEVFISPQVSQKVLQHLRLPKSRRGGLDDLSAREFDLLRALGAGMSLTQCARHLNVTTSTASTYRARLMDKLGLTTTAEIIRFAIENDIVG